MSDNRLLIVDDQPEILETIEDILENFLEEFEIDTAPSVDDALALIDANTYKIICTDFLMPGKSGVDLINSIRGGSSSNKDTPILIVTATSKEVEEHVKGISMVKIVDKSSNIAELVEIITNEVEGID
jgi:DNA-binding response OmpR family regulator